MPCFVVFYFYFFFLISFSVLITLLRFQRYNVIIITLGRTLFNENCTLFRAYNYKNLPTGCDNGGVTLPRTNRLVLKTCLSDVRKRHRWRIITPGVRVSRRLNRFRTYSAVTRRMGGKDSRRREPFAVDAPFRRPDKPSPLRGTRIIPPSTTRAHPRKCENVTR